MNKRTSLLVSMFVFALASITLLAEHPQVTVGQQQQPQTAHLICCNLLLSVPGTWIGADRKCSDYMNGASSGVRASVCEQLRRGGAPLCTDVANYCSTGTNQPPAKCDKPTPGLDPSSRPGCQDLQTPQITLSQGVATLSICGYPVFRFADPDLKDPAVGAAYTTALRDSVKNQMGSKVCCDSFRKAVSSGVPCDPRTDLDCDGKPNDADFDTNGLSDKPNAFPDIDLFTRPEGAPIDPFPVGLDPDDPNFIPPAGKCDCKWELLKGTLSCSADGKLPHSYQARWRCPSTGNEVFTRKEAPAAAPCK